MKLEKFQEQIYFSTVRISISSKVSQSTSIGTGFIFSAPLNDAQNRSVILLISNKHVYGDPTQNIMLNFHQRDQADISRPALGHIKPLQANDFSGLYSEHPDPDVDLACLNISTITRPEHQIFYKVIKPDMFAEFQEDDLLPGNDVWFIGYPENRYDITHNLPILRRGYIASIPKVDFNGRKQMVIDAQVFPGSSGSPVFTVLGSNYKLIGVITETMIRHQKLQTIPTGVSAGIEQVLGLGIVLKATLVKELIDTVIAKISAELSKKQPEPVVEKSDET